MDFDALLWGEKCVLFLVSCPCPRKMWPAMRYHPTQDKVTKSLTCDPGMLPLSSPEDTPQKNAHAETFLNLHSAVFRVPRKSPILPSHLCVADLLNTHFQLLPIFSSPFLVPCRVMTESMSTSCGYTAPRRSPYQQSADFRVRPTFTNLSNRQIVSVHPSAPPLLPHSNPAPPTQQPRSTRAHQPRTAKHVPPAQQAAVAPPLAGVPGHVSPRCALPSPYREVGLLGNVSEN